MKIELIVVGRLKSGPYHELIQEYKKRISWSLSIREVDSKVKNEAQAQNDEIKQIVGLIDPKAFVLACDERGKTLSSRQLSDKLATLMQEDTKLLQIVIGGANGIGEILRARANFLLSFGQQTWPHMLVRVMLMEQIYRSQQILKGHPYHKD